MTNATHYVLIDRDNSTGNYVLVRNGEPIAEFYTDADATLTLCAPELLEALKQAEKCIETLVGRSTVSATLFVIRAAIARAESK